MYGGVAHGPVVSRARARDVAAALERLGVAGRDVRAGQVEHSQGARVGEEGRPGRACCVTGAGSKGGVSGGDVLDWARSGGAEGEGKGAGQARAAEKKGRRERGGRREKRKEKRKKMEKRKEKKKEGREKGKRREGERDPRRDHGADRGAGRPRLASGRARARRAGRGETGCRIRVSGLWGIGRSGGTGRIPENWG